MTDLRLSLKGGCHAECCHRNTEFSILRDNGYLYIDKTDFIKEWWESDKLTTADKEFFKRVSKNMVGTDASFALHQLSKFMYQYYGKRVIILLDEYDTPLQEAFVHGFWKELVAFMRSMFNVTFKTNPYLYRAVMTGISRVRNYNMINKERRGKHHVRLFNCWCRTIRCRICP